MNSIKLHLKPETVWETQKIMPVPNFPHVLKILNEAVNQVRREKRRA